MLIGIVGAPNKGKSTLFSSLTLTTVDIADYAFTTIKPNEGIGYVRVKDIAPGLGVAASPKTGYIKNGYRFIPLKLIDVAGLVPNAYKGKGLGNKFLNDLIPADVLVHVIDVSGKTDLQGNKNLIDPEQEINFLGTELDRWLFGILKRNWDKVRFKNISSLSAVLSGMKISESDIEHVADKLNLDKERINWDKDQIFSFAEHVRKLSKPIIIAANKSDVASSKANITNLENKGHDIVPVSAVSELTLKRAAKSGLIDYVPGANKFNIIKTVTSDQENALEFIKKNVLEVYGSTGAQQLLEKAVFDILKMKVVYPVEDENKLSDSFGNVLPEAKLVPQNITPYALAGMIHTDIQKGYQTAIDGVKKTRIAKDHVLDNNSVIKIVFR